MELQTQNLERLAIYFFFDPEGIVDKYVLYMLEDIKKNVSDLLIVCNGKLTPQGRKAFIHLTPNLLVRENDGFDVWAYKEAIEFWGWDKIRNLDELILMNSTIMGPIYPLSEMFAEMNSRDLDFWGITEHMKLPIDPFGKIKYGYIPAHLQSHFLAIRRHMLQSAEFQNYWDQMPKIRDYSDSVALHEVVFTKEFADKGFTWASYVDTSDMDKVIYNPITLDPLELVKNRKCPIIKRRIFFHNYNELLTVTNADTSRVLFEYIRDHTDYDVDMIWENILRTQHMADIKNNLQLNYVIPSGSSLPKSHRAKRIRIALVMHIYFIDQIEYCYKYAMSVPNDCDVFITTNTEEKKDAITRKFGELPCGKLDVRVIENRGRDVSALLTATRADVMNYDLVCFLHDKKVGQLDWTIKGEAFANQCFDNLIKNKTFVENVIQVFNDNPRLGMLVPPPPGFADYYFTHGYSWGLNYPITKKLYGELGLTIPISEDKEPIAPLGTMFWFRPDALRILFDRNWQYSDYPPEPNMTDGTLLHAIERIYPFVAQQAGYYSAWSFSDDFARTQLTNLEFMLSEINKRAFMIYGMNSHHSLLTAMDISITMGNKSLNLNRLIMPIKNLAKKILPPKMWSWLRSKYIAKAS